MYQGVGVSPPLLSRRNISWLCEAKTYKKISLFLQAFYHFLRFITFATGTECQTKQYNTTKNKTQTKKMK